VVGAVDGESVVGEQVPDTVEGLVGVRHFAPGADRVVAHGRFAVGGDAAVLGEQFRQGLGEADIDPPVDFGGEAFEWDYLSSR
jgi:hypothetical protein